MKKKKLNEIEKLMKKMNPYKISGMKDPFKELLFLISPGLISRNETKSLFFNTINWLYITCNTV